MTIEDLIGMSADELEKMTDKQLEDYFAPYLCVTRPDLAMIENAKKKSLNVSKFNGGSKVKTQGREMAEQFMLKQFGVKL